MDVADHVNFYRTGAAVAAHDTEANLQLIDCSKHGLMRYNTRANHDTWLVLAPSPIDGPK